MDMTGFNEFAQTVSTPFEARLDHGAFFTFANSAGNHHVISETDMRTALEQWLTKSSEIEEKIRSERSLPADANVYTYDENAYRAVFREFFRDDRFNTIAALARSQTKPLLATMSMYVGYLTGNRACADADPLLLDSDSIARAVDRLTIAVGFDDEVALDAFVTEPIGWNDWHADYNLIERGDRIVVGIADGGGTPMWYEGLVSSIGIIEAEGDPRYRVETSGLIRKTSNMNDELAEAVARSSKERGRGVLVGRDEMASLSEVVRDFADAVREANLDYGERHEDLVRAFAVSLATKRFALLTGLSGSGKTRLAMAFGQWLGDDHYQVEAVRPDWTGPDALLGYEDGLSVLKETGRAWHVPLPLEFMLRAARDPRHAYLLILDEMNLAHVERYFADVLSGMESNEPILPNLALGGGGEWRVIYGEDERIPFPLNLFVVGTVNIDETTYMFSPKVLDRANTLEFRVRTEDLVVHTLPPGNVVRGSRELVHSFLSSALNDTEFRLESAELATYLRDLHRLLSEDDREFGHRVFFEAQRFGGLLADAGDDDVLSALDLQVMQKVLPRYHGSIRQLSRPLSTIGEWAFRLAVSADGFDPLEDDLDVAQAKLPISFDKIRRMTRRLRANHFVSFAE